MLSELLVATDIDIKNILKIKRETLTETFVVLNSLCLDNNRNIESFFYSLQA